MILLFCFLITLFNYSCYAVKSETIENVYIDTLVQRYLTEERYLWDLINSNSSNHIDRNVYSIMNKIRSNHLDILNDEYLEYVMSEEYMGKFNKYVDFYHIHNTADEYEQLILTKSLPESYMTVDMAFSVYNNNREDMLFEKIAEVSYGSQSGRFAPIERHHEQNMLHQYHIPHCDVVMVISSKCCD